MKELPQRSFLPNNSIKEKFSKKAARFLLKNPATRLLPVSVLIFAGCSGGGGEKNNTQELENKVSSGYSLPFPEGETWFLTTGPHGDSFSAIDIAPPELGRLNGDCPTDGSRLSIDNRVVTASASGEVVLAGKDNDRNDPFHSIVDIKDNNGLTQRYVHLDNIRVKSGKKIKQGEALGNPSCEYPPKGRNTGPHLHVGLMKDEQAIPIDGVVVGGWTIHEGVDGKDGTMTKPGEETRTANVGRYGGRYGKDSTGIRNDLPNNSNKAVVASPKDPISPISGKVNEKSVSSTLTSNIEKPVEAGWTRFKSSLLPYQIDYPSDWDAEDRGELSSTLFDGKQLETSGHVEVKANSASMELALDTYKEQRITELGKVYKIMIKKAESLYIDGQKTWKIEYMQPPFVLDHRITYLFMKDGKEWEITFSAKDSIFEKERPEFEKMLASFNLLDETIVKPTETPKPAVENKISISKKPDELYRVLLTNPISSDVLPQGMSSGGISAGEIDATGKALNQIGAITIAIEDSISEAVKGIPNGAVFYGIFPDSSKAKSASEVIGTHLKNGQVLKDFPYPTKIYTIENFFGGITAVLVTSVENVTVAATFTGAHADLVQSRTIELAKSAIEHLGRVGK